MSFWTYGYEGWNIYKLDSEHPYGYAKVTEETGPAPTEVWCPGFVDIHIHGAFGIDFMTATKDQMVTLTDQLDKRGYEAFLPTTVTAPLDQVREAIENLPNHPLIAGFHLEGPFISPEFPGAQPREHILCPKGHMETWKDIIDHPRLRRITMAPEAPGAMELITRMDRHGVEVSIGHSNATSSECREAFKLGAEHSTHTFNAMRPLHQREPGVVGFVLLEPNVKAELIYDGHHVHKDAAKLLAKTRTVENLIAVSDSTLAAGLPDQALTMWGHQANIKEGTVRLKDGSLAGSAATLDECFKYLWRDFGPQTAISACCLNPRRVLGLPPKPRKWLKLDQDGGVTSHVS